MRRSGGGRGIPMKPDSQPPDQAARIPGQDDTALVARARAGDRAAFGALAERYAGVARRVARAVLGDPDRKSTRLNSSHSQISYAVFCLKKKKESRQTPQ